MHMRMDAAEGEDAAKGAGDQETASDVAEISKKEGGAKGEHVIAEKKGEMKPRVIQKNGRRTARTALQSMLPHTQHKV